MYIRAFLACLVCKLLHAVIRFLGRGGTALPGRVALRICPGVLKLTAKGVHTLAVTGTNGKTTSARIAETALRHAGLSVFSNRSGANLIDGIACAYILNTDLFLKPRCRYAVIECDEASVRRVLGEIRPKALLVTNLFRDQLDRYGTISAPRDAIADGLRKSPETTVCLNADCPMAASIADIVPNKTVFFGFACGDKKKTGSGEDDHCVFCGGKLHYSFVTYANCGDYLCTRCGKRRHDTDVTVTGVTDDGSFVLCLAAGKSLVKAALGGLYNVYNAAGSAALVAAGGIDISHAISAASDFECGFGRMEEFPLGKKGAKMILIKNAAAADQTLELIKEDKSEKTVVFIINNRPSDGTDISWINDADIGKLARLRGVRRIIASGDRAESMAECIKNEGMSCETVPDYGILLKILKEEESFIYLLPTYTAMLELRQRIVKKLGGKNFWE